MESGISPDIDGEIVMMSVCGRGGWREERIRVEAVDGDFPDIEARVIAMTQP